MREPTKPRKAIKRKNDPQGVRNRLLDAAAHLFQSNGYQSTATPQIAAAAGVSPGAMHHHFPTKKDLGIAVIRERVADVIRETWIDRMSNQASAIDAVAAIFDDIACGLDANGKVEGCPLNNLTLELALGDHDFRDAVGPVFDRWRTAIADRVRKDHRARLSMHMDPDGFATHVIAACSGALAMGKAAQSSEALRIVARQIDATYRM